MTKTSDFSDDELANLAGLEGGPKAVSDVTEEKLVTSGVADRADRGLKITGLGRVILEEARNTGRLPRNN